MFVDLHVAVRPFMNLTGNPFTERYNIVPKRPRGLEAKTTHSHERRTASATSLDRRVTSGPFWETRTTSVPSLEVSPRRGPSLPSSSSKSPSEEDGEEARMRGRGGLSSSCSFQSDRYSMNTFKLFTVPVEKWWGLVYFYVIHIWRFYFFYKKIPV